MGDVKSIHSSSPKTWREDAVREAWAWIRGSSYINARRHNPEGHDLKIIKNGS